MIWTEYGYGIVEDEKTVDQMAKKKYIKVKKIKKSEPLQQEENSKLHLLLFPNSIQRKYRNWRKNNVGKRRW